ncbi:protein of unknown function [Epsilonproteobacteria bacterium SCGC AD-308-E02]|nr:protein of unknown function [Epsilonproteobacteria bacterium SCGC AD-308-E02]
MPTILKIDGFRFFFFSNEHSPEHIHIEKGDTYARIELESLKVTDSYNLDSKDLKKLVALVKKNREKLQGDWNEYFTS